MAKGPRKKKTRRPAATPPEPTAPRPLPDRPPAEAETSPPAQPAAGPGPPPDREHWIGAACLGVATLLSALLVIDHFVGLGLPGCGETGGCADAARSPWGKVPGTSWPVSFVGLAYFGALLTAWLTSRRGVPPAFVQVVRLGVLASVAFLMVLLVEGHLCLYCMGTHAANFGFWIVVERADRSEAQGVRPLVVLAATFLGVTALLAPVERRSAERALARLEADVDASVAEIIGASREDRPAPEPPAAPRPGAEPEPGAAAPPRTAPEPTPAPATEPSPAPAVEPPSPPGAPARREGFTGRYHRGPAVAPVRMVIISDYQCSDCQAVEAVVRRIMAQRSDVSLSVKHFPMDAECNPHLSRSLHPNACWAARAAEAAGQLQGDDGFWRMHHWLFDQGGAFTQADLPRALRELGFPRDTFIDAMSGEEVLRLVQDDIEEAIGLGLHFTPMIFINGRQVRGIFEANAESLVNAVDRIASSGAVPATAAGDRPPGAREKAVGDWMHERETHLPADQPARTLGDGEAVRIVMWGDYQETRGVPLADLAIRSWMQGRADARYTFRHFPVDQSCNPSAFRTLHPRACRAARIAEAAGLLGGDEAYWRMHEWLLSHQLDLSDDALIEPALDAGLDPGELLATLEDPRVTAAIVQDARAAKSTPEQQSSRLYRGSIPTIYVNEKVVPRWQLNWEPVIEDILDAAALE